MVMTKIDEDIAKHISVSCPICGIYQHPVDGGFDDFEGRLLHRVRWLKFICPEHGEFYIRNCRVSDMDL